MQLEFPSYEVPENAGYLEVCVVPFLSSVLPLERSAQVNIVTLFADAKGNSSNTYNTSFHIVKMLSLSPWQGSSLMSPNVACPGSVVS